jgi:hypothetical protein
LERAGVAGPGRALPTPASTPPGSIGGPPQPAQQWASKGRSEGVTWRWPLHAICSPRFLHHALRPRRSLSVQSPARAARLRDFLLAVASDTRQTIDRPTRQSSGRDMAIFGKRPLENVPSPSASSALITHTLPDKRLQRPRESRDARRQGNSHCSVDAARLLASAAGMSLVLMAHRRAVLRPASRQCSH